jgi:ribosome-binding factor A
METKRQRQVAEMVRRNFSIVLQEEGSYLYGQEPLVTVTGVNLTPDFGLAKIYLSIYNTENKQAVIMLMNEEIVKLRQSLAYRIRKHVRRIPNIAFYIDETMDEMYRVDALFNRLRQEKQMGGEEPESGE